MSVWEVINVSDPVTLVTGKFDLACATTMLIGFGQYALREVDGEKREMPMFNFMPVMELQNWFEATFPDKMMLEGETPYDKFFDGLDKLELAEVLRTVQVCSVKDREAYNMALSAIDDPRKKQDYAIWWKEQRSTSLNDIAHRAWDFADKLEALLRKEGHT